VVVSRQGLLDPACPFRSAAGGALVACRQGPLSGLWCPAPGFSRPVLRLEACGELKKRFSTVGLDAGWCLLLVGAELASAAG